MISPALVQRKGVVWRRANALGWLCALIGTGVFSRRERDLTSPCYNDTLEVESLMRDLELRSVYPQK